MSDRFYNFVWGAGCHVFWLTSKPVVIGADRTKIDGPFILAATHSSAYDIPLLIRHTRRVIDFVSTVEVFSQGKLFAWFYRSLGAFPLDRSKPDAPTVRTILDRLANGRVVAIFPEGGIKKEQHAVYNTRKMRPGIGRIAKLANVPIVPVVLLGSIAYSKWWSWLPIRQVRYGVIYGEPIVPDQNDLATEELLIARFVSLNGQLRDKMNARVSETP